MADGAPRDEYGAESDTLTSLVVRDQVTEAAVLAVWERAFGPGSGLSQRPDILAAMTVRLLDLQAAHPQP